MRKYSLSAVSHRLTLNANYVSHTTYMYSYSEQNLLARIQQNPESSIAPGAKCGAQWEIRVRIEDRVIDR